MVFKKMMRAFGVGGPTVDTVLPNPNIRPGLALDGYVRLTGGDHDVTIEQIVLGLVTRVDSEHGSNMIEFHRLPVAGMFQLRQGEQRDLPFSFPVPWETPVTHFYGQRLPGMTMGVRTELSVAKSIDKGDLDEVAIHPLPVQDKILEAFAQQGFRFKKADIEQGGISGVHQQFPFYQEIEFYPPPQFQGSINEVEVTFVADPNGVEVILEFDKRGGFLTPGHDAYGRYRVSHGDAESTDWMSVVNGWVSEASGRYQGMLGSHGMGMGMGGHGMGHGAPGYGAPGHGAPGYGAPGHGAPGYGAPGYGAPGYGAPGHGAPGYGAPGYGAPAYGHGGHGGGYHGHTQHRSGPGFGAVAAGVAGGVVGGMVLGEVMDDMFEGDDEGDSEE